MSPVMGDDEPGDRGHVNVQPDDGAVIVMTHCRQVGFVGLVVPTRVTRNGDGTASPGAMYEAASVERETDPVRLVTELEV